MNSELMVIIASCLISLGVFSSNPMFSMENRPALYRGKWGELFFVTLSLIIMISAVSIGIWSFTEIKWYINILLVIGTISAFSYIYQRLFFVLGQSALAPIVASIGLLILNYILWF